ncbi:ATP-binding protein [Pseudacidobacterium ailaaui]|jgi:DNA replication protein DnaC|uniref:ATP-binding protein n=1 Tax=Pseudacidobacterium ailaaui TaxID=1382359 RepID=UPI00047979BA|nr:ATP-binding protein [Pseudacidobacterium ailaaui]MDI3254801.1 ATP-binding protein [Bacillota bacterium]
MAETCIKCDGMGMRVIKRADGSSAAEPCECQQERRISRLIERARIPPRYRHCTLQSFEVGRHSHESLRAAFLMADRFITAFPLETEGKGLLFTGSMGVGKTHLAVGLLLALITERGAQGLFCDYRELLKQIQESYNPSTHITELQVLQPVFDAEVLLLDDLGYIRPTEWVWDTVALILNARYNARRTTLITTNYPNLPAAGAQMGKESSPMGRERRMAEAALREETLGDRIGERMRSRLLEMCVEVRMEGQDLRQTVKRARFS